MQGICKDLRSFKEMKSGPGSAEHMGPGVYYTEPLRLASPMYQPRSNNSSMVHRQKSVTSSPTLFLSQDKIGISHIHEAFW